MPFRIPTAYCVPILALILGLSITWFEYKLNLATDLGRNLEEVVAEMDALGDGMALRSGTQAEHGEAIALAEELPLALHKPWLEQAALVNENGVVINVLDGQWLGKPANETPLAPAMKLATSGQRPQKNEVYETLLYGAYPFPMGARGTGWALVLFDRTEAVQHVRADVFKQSRLLALVISLICLCLWAVLHFGFAARIARLAQAVRDFGDGTVLRVPVISGYDEVHELSLAFATMAASLAEREAERVELERIILDASEREQQRIGEDLHDGVGQRLTAASLATNGLISELQSAAPELVAQAENLARELSETTSEVRALVHGLVPTALADEGLMQALHKLADVTSRSAKVHCIFDCLQPVRVPDPVLAGHLYRIAQEAVNNALKHAKANEIRIGLEQSGERVVLEVDDDGDGLPETLEEGDGIGLRVMRHRARLIGGTIEIGLAPAGGARIACTVPASR